jgi:hypothetical protein
MLEVSFWVLYVSKELVEEWRLPERCASNPDYLHIGSIRMIPNIVLNGKPEYVLMRSWPCHFAMLYLFSD